MMNQKANETEEEEDLTEAFKILDRGKDGLIDINQDSFDYLKVSAKHFLGIQTG